MAHSSFSDSFEGWMHLKAMRLFVESVLRYGLPPIFTMAVVKPLPKQHKQVKRILDNKYSYLGGIASGNPGSRDGGGDIEGEFASMMLDDDYSPFAWFPINWI